MSNKEQVIIEVQSTEIINNSGVSARTGKPYSIDKQIGWAHMPGQPYPVQIELEPMKNEHNQAQPYAVGSYALAPSSFYVDRYKSLCIKPVLIALADSKPLKATA